MAIGFGIASRNWWRAQLKGGLFPSFSLNFDTIGTDFTFTRNSFATRVNEFGLIETVTNLGSNLVQNGNFEELGTEQVSNGNFALGSEKITNGDFATDSDWTLESGWTIEDGKAECSGNASHSYLLQSESFTSGVTYKITFDIVVDSGSFEVRLLGSGSDSGGIITSSQTEYTEYITASANRSNFGIRSNDGNGIGSIDNVSVKEVTDWSLGSNWSVENNEATTDGTQGYLVQTGTPPSGTSGTYKFEWTQEITSGTRFRIFPRNGNDTSQSGVTILSGSTTGSGNFFTNGNCVGSGTFTAYIETTDGFSVKFLAESGNEGTITNVSVKQVDPNGYWINEGVWIIKDGVASGNGANGSAQELKQNGTVTAGKTYRFSYEIKNYVSGGFGLYNDIVDSGGFVSANGVYTGTFVASINQIRLRGNAFFNGDVTNISIQEVLTDDIPRIDFTGSTFDVPVLSEELIINGDFTNGSANWSIGSNSEINNGSARIYSPSGSYTFVSQSNVLTIGKTYLISLEIVEQNSGEIRLSDGNAYLSNSFSGVGVHTFTSTSTGTILRIQRTASITDIRIDNVSVKEVTAYTTEDKGAFLLEPQSTNLIEYSEDFDNSYWTTNGSSLTSGFTSPSGNLDAFELTENASSGGHSLNGDTLSSINGEEYTYSLFVKYNGKQWFRLWGQYGNSSLGAYFDIQNGLLGSKDSGVTSDIEDYGNGWYRISAKATSDGTINRFRGYLADADNNFLYDGDGVSGAYVWGAQLEALDYSTSYIPTNSTTVTRAQETCLDGIVSANSLEGVLYWEGSSNDDSTMIMTELSQGNITNRVSLYSQSSDARGSIRINGSQKNLTGGGSLVTAKKLAVVWSNNIVSFWANGSQIDTDTYVGSIPEGVLTALNFAQVGGAAPFYGRTKDLRIYNKALTDDELINLTTI